MASGPEPPARRSALGTSSTWILKDEYSFSSGPWLGSESKELLGLMARSKEPTDNGSLSTWDISTPGLLISSSDGKFLKLVCGLGRLLPVGIVATGASKVSFTWSLLLSGGTVLAGGLATLAGTLDGTVPAYTELMGNFDGVILVSAVEGFVLTGNLEATLEGMVFTGTDLVEGGMELVVTELAGTPSLVLR